MIKTHSAWKKIEHFDAYNFWNKISDSYFKYLYGSFKENQYLLNILRDEKLNIAEIGCAVGYGKRFLNLNKLKNLYVGYDISNESIKNAKLLYGDELFHHIDENNLSEQIISKPFDVVYSRDTVPHQIDPYNFLNELIKMTKKHLILRLRTRDTGETILNHELSCQLQPGDEWAPYIVLNYDELINFLKKTNRVTRIEVNRSYVVLGGQNFRYLEKALYMKKTKTAETSMNITFDGSKESPMEIIETFDLEGHDFIKVKKVKTLFYKILNRIKL
jgi:hypothetical protein